MRRKLEQLAVGAWKYNYLNMETRIDRLFINPSDIFQAVYLDQKVAVKEYKAKKFQDVQAFLIEAAIMTYVKCDIVLL